MKFLRATTLLGTLVSLAALTACDLTGGETKKTNSLTNQDQTTAGQASVKLFGTGKDSAAATAISEMPTKIGGQLDPAARAQLVTSNENYRAAVIATPDDPAANFGLAVTSLSLKVDDLSDSLKRMWDKGLRVGEDDNPGGMFQSNPTALVSSQAFSARKLSDPANAPQISDLQNMLETKLMPTVDSAILLLTKCWNTPGFQFRFPIKAFDRTDSLTIGRADIGFALAGLRTAKAYFTWLLAQNLDCQLNGSYTWLDSMSNIDDSLGPKAGAQTEAYLHLQDLLSSSSSFLTLRTAYVSKVAAIPDELIAISQLAKQAGDYSVLHQPSLREGLVRLDANDNAKLAEVMDSVRLYLGGMRTYVKPPHTEYEYDYSNPIDTTVTYEFNGQSYSYKSFTYARRPVQYPGFSITVNARKLITQADHKVFLPKFTWNPASAWPTKGPFNLTGSRTISVKELDEMELDGPLDFAPYIEWVDPTFGGAFAFRNSTAVLQQMEDMNDRPLESGSFSPRILF